MAKKKKSDTVVKEGEKAGSKILSALIVIAIIFIWLFVIAVLIKWNAGGFGSALRPVLEDVPLVNKILPSDSSEETSNSNEYAYKNMAEAVARIKELEDQINQLSGSNTSDNATITQLQAEVERLKVFEDNQKAFEERVKEFDANVVFNDQAPDISEYAKYYEGIDPQNAEEIYRQVMEQTKQNEKITKKAEEFAAMEPAKAASILEEMSEDIDLVAGILDSMTTKQSALILENMSTERAAQLTKKRSQAD